MKTPDGQNQASNIKTSHPRRNQNSMKFTLDSSSCLEHLQVNYKHKQWLYKQHHATKWNIDQRIRWAAFNESSWLVNLSKPGISEGAICLIIDDILVRDFFCCRFAEMLASVDILEYKKTHAGTLMNATNVISMGEWQKMTRMSVR